MCLFSLATLAKVASAKNTERRRCARKTRAGWYNVGSGRRKVVSGPGDGYTDGRTDGREEGTDADADGTSELDLIQVGQKQLEQSAAKSVYARMSYLLLLRRLRH